MREEGLRTTSDLRHAQGLRLSAWRGRSGRRYVVGVHALADAAETEMTQAVVIAVRRSRDGAAEVVAVAAAEGVSAGFPTTWMRDVGAKGATELHVHRLAHGGAERRAIMADLEGAG